MVSLAENVCTGIKIDLKKKRMELLGQTYASPEHYIRYREFINIKRSKVMLIGRGELVVGTSFRENGTLKSYEYTITPEFGSQFKGIKDFVDSARICLAEELWNYVNKNELRNIRIPKTLENLYIGTIIQEEVVKPIEEYLIPKFERDSDPLISIIIIHLLLDMLIKFAENFNTTTKSFVTNVEKVWIRFEKKIKIDVNSVEENYRELDTEKDDGIIIKLKREGIKAVVNKEIIKEIMLEHIIENPSTVAFKDILSHRAVGVT